MSYLAQELGELEIKSVVFIHYGHSWQWGKNIGFPQF